MIYLKLFFTFLEIGAVSFGGGYGMIALMREKVLANGWMTEEAFLSFVAVSESTPGPLAVNMATFIGASQGGIFGAFLATLGVVLPAFVIILIIASVLRNLMRYSGVRAFLSGVRPCVAGMILATGMTMAASVFFQFKKIGDLISVDVKACLLFAVLAIVGLLWKILKKEQPSPSGMILLSAGLGILFYC